MKRIIRINSQSALDKLYKHLLQVIEEFVDDIQPVIQEKLDKYEARLEQDNWFSRLIFGKKTPDAMMECYKEDLIDAYLKGPVTDIIDLMNSIKDGKKVVSFAEDTCMYKNCKIDKFLYKNHE